MRHIARRARPAFVLAPLALALAGLPALADDAGLELEEITVTAQRRSENIQDVPISMSVETAQTLAKKNITNLEGLSYQTPSLVTQAGGRTPVMAIRGLGSPGLDTVESSVGIYNDEVYFGRSRLASNPLFDMDRVEVLRGPQGTLYGRNTIAGAIGLYTARPTDEFSGRVLAEYGNLDSYRFEGFVSGPLTDTLSGRLSALSSQRGTYIDNTIGPDAGGLQSGAVRGSLRWTPRDDLTVFAKYEHMRHDNVGIFEQLVGDPFGVWADYPGIDLKADDKQQVAGVGLQAINDPGGHFEADVGALHVNWDLPSDYTLRSVTGLNSYDAKSKDYIGASPDNSLSINGLTENTSYFSEELRLESPTDQRFHFAAGGLIDYYRIETMPRVSQFAALNFGPRVLPALVDGLATNPALGFLGPLQDDVANGYAVGTEEYFRLITPSGAPDGSSSNLVQRIKTWSAFFEGEYEFTEQWHLIMGVRYTSEYNQVRLAKGTWYRTGNGLPWGSYPTGSEIADSAIAAYPDLASLGGLLDVIYGSVNNSPIGPGLTFSQLPTVIAAPGGTPRAYDGVDDDHWIPSLKLQYYPNDDMMFYFTVSSGFKAGGFNSANINVYSRATDTFKPEEALAFELGGKMTLLDGAAQLDFAIYRTNFDDLQVGTVTPAGAATVLNAAQAVTQGVDINGTWRVAEAVTVGASYAYLDAYYDDSDDLVCGGIQQAYREAAGEDFSDTPCMYRLDELRNGDDLQQAPENTVSVWAEYYTAVADGWDLQVFGAVNYRDEASTSLENYLWSDSITLVNGRVALYDNRNRWSVALYGNNLLDDDGLLSRSDNSGGAVKGMLTTPRTYGVQVVKDF